MKMSKIYVEETVQEFVPSFIIFEIIFVKGGAFLSTFSIQWGISLWRIMIQISNLTILNLLSRVTN